MASPVQVAAQNDRGAETADVIEIVVVDLTSWAHLLTARQPRCDHCSALTKAPRPSQLRDKEKPPLQEGPIFTLERSELAKRGAFSLPRSRQSPTNGFRSPSPSVASYGHCARIWFTPYVQPPSYRTVVRLRKPRPAGRHAGCDTSTQNVVQNGHVTRLKWPA